MNKLIWATGFVLVAMSGQAFAYCPNQPDGSETRYVDNAQQRILCLNKQLNDTTQALEESSQFDALSDRVNNNAIQRRFDMLPPVQPGWNF